MRSQANPTEILAAKLKKVDCHFTWFFSEEIFRERLLDNENSCLNHIAETPDHAAYNFLAFLYFKNNQKKEARYYFEEALNQYPGDPVTLANLAHFYFSLGMTELSAQYLQQLEYCEENLVKGRVAWAQAYFEVRMFRYKEAINLYEQAIKLLPNDKPFLLLLKSILLNREKKYRDAIVCLEEAKTTNPQDPQIHLQLGRAYGGLNGKENKTKSLKHFETALSLSEQKENIYKFMADIYCRQGKQLDKAIELYSKSIVEKENTMAYHHRGLVYKKKKKYDLAKADFEKALELKPANYSVAIDLIDIYHIMKEYQEIIVACSTLPKNYQNYNASVLLNWGKGLMQLNEKQIGEEKFLKICSLKYAPKNLWIEAYQYLIEYYTEGLKSKEIAEFAAKLLSLYIQTEALEDAKKHAALYSSTCIRHFGFCYHVARLYLLIQEAGLFGVYLEQAFSATQTSQEKDLCHHLYLQAKNHDDFAEYCLPFLQKYEQERHQYDGPIWSKNLTVLFNSKQPHKKLLISSAVHQDLKQDVSDKHILKNNKKFNRANFNTAIIQFVVSDREHNASKTHGRICVSVPLYKNHQQDFDEMKVQHVTDYYEFRVGKKGEFSRSELLLEDVLLSKPAHKQSNINAMFQDKESHKFHRTFHCSERALFGFLQQENTINHLLDEVDLALNQQPHIKFYAFILDIHSDRYLCGECEESIYYWYDPKGVFFSKLVAAIQERGHCVSTKSKTLDAIVRVSAKQPASQQTVVPLNEHCEEAIDIKQQKKKTCVTLLQRDDTSFEGERSTNNFVFSSTK